jgi:hypothetical protein
MSREAMKMALKRLEAIDAENNDPWDEPSAEVKALRQELVKPEQAEKQDVPEPLMKIIREKFTSGNSVAVERITLKRSECDAALAKPEQAALAKAEGSV